MVTPKGFELNGKPYTGFVYKKNDEEIDVHSKNSYYLDFFGMVNNGLKYVLNNDNTFKSCSIFIFVRVGSKHEKKEEYGMAHFLEHILFKGTKKYRTNLELNRKIDSLSATTNASTGKNFTCYFLKLPSINTEEGIELLKEMVFL